MPICANNEARAVEVIQNALNANGPFEVELLSGGCSGSAVFKVAAPDSAYVVRFWNMKWVEYYPQDLACQIIASDAGYAPRLFFIDEAMGITVMKYHYPEALPETQTRLQLLVDLLKRIHSGPVVPKGIDRTIYLDELIKESSNNPFFLDQNLIKSVKDAVFAATRPNALCVPCHRDLHPGNLIYTTNSFLALDYTWGAMDDPYADLANIAIFNCVNPEEEHCLLKMYLGHEPSHEDVARLSLMKLPAKMFYGLEFLGLASVNSMDSNTAIKLLPKSYMNFGRHGVVPSQADFIEYAISILSEVVDYSLSEQYAQDLAIVRAKGGEMAKAEGYQ